MSTERDALAQALGAATEPSPDVLADRACGMLTIAGPRAWAGLPSRSPGAPNRWRFVSVNGGDATLAVPDRGPT